MARLYSNVNDRFRHSNLGRVTNQQLHKVQNLTTPSPEAVAAQEIRATAESHGETRLAKQAMLELRRDKHLLDARTDKRRRDGSSKAAFKLYRECGLVPPNKLKKKKKPHPAK